MEKDHEFAVPAPVTKPRSEAVGVYSSPSWGGLPEEGAPVVLEVMKNGVILEEVELKGRDHFVIGRQNDSFVHILSEHPSISRYHAVLQLKQTTGQLYLYDLGSTWGSFVNTQRIQQKVYTELHSGDLLRFGESTRTYIVQTENGSVNSDSGEIVAEAGKRVDEKQEPADSSKAESMSMDQKLHQIHIQNQERQRISREQILALRNNDNQWGQSLDTDDQIRTFQQNQETNDNTLLTEEDLANIDTQYLLTNNKLNLSHKQALHIKKLEDMRNRLVAVHTKIDECTK